MLTEKIFKRAKNDVLNKAKGLSKYGSIPVIDAINRNAMVA